MKLSIKTAVTFGLMCFVAFEAANVLPSVISVPTVSKINPESLVASGPRVIDVNVDEGLVGVIESLSEAQSRYQKESTKDVAEYIANTESVERDRIEEAHQQAIEKKEYMTEQEWLVSEYERLKEEMAKEDPGVSLNDDLPEGTETPGIYEVSGGTLDKPDKVTDVTTGEIIKDSTEGNTFAENETSFPETNVQGTTNNDVDVSSEENVDDPTKYYGEFNVTIVCTCPVCYDKVTWSESKENETFAIASSQFFPSGSHLKLSGDIDGTFVTREAGSLLAGRNLIVFHADHNLGGGTRSGSVDVYLDNPELD